MLVTRYTLDSMLDSTLDSQLRSVVHGGCKYHVYCRFTPKQRATLGKYASLHGVLPAARQYSSRWRIHLSEATVRSIRDAYLCEVNMRTRMGEDDQANSLPERE